MLKIKMHIYKTRPLPTRTPLGCLTLGLQTASYKNNKRFSTAKHSLQKNKEDKYPNRYCSTTFNLHTYNGAHSPRVRDFQPEYLTKLNDNLQYFKILYLYGKPEVDKKAFIQALCAGLNLVPEFITSFKDFKTATYLDHPDRVLVLTIKPSLFKKREGDFMRMLKLYDDRTIALPRSYVSIPRGLKRVLIADTSPAEFIKTNPKLFGEGDTNFFLNNLISPLEILLPTAHTAPLVSPL